MFVQQPPLFSGFPLMPLSQGPFIPLFQGNLQQGTIDLHSQCPLLRQSFLVLMRTQIEKRLPYVIARYRENNQITFYDALSFVRDHPQGYRIHSSEQFDSVNFYAIGLRDQSLRVELLPSTNNDFIKTYLLACMYDDTYAKEIFRARNSLIRHFFERRELNQSLDWLFSNYRDFRNNSLITTFDAIVDNLDEVARDPSAISKILRSYLFKERLQRVKEAAQSVIAFGTGVAVGFGIPSTFRLPLHLSQFLYAMHHLHKNIRDNSTPIYLGTIGSSITTLIKIFSEFLKNTSPSPFSMMRMFQLVASGLAGGVALPALSSEQTDPWKTSIIDHDVIETV